MNEQHVEPDTICMCIILIITNIYKVIIQFPAVSTVLINLKKINFGKSSCTFMIPSYFICYSFYCYMRNP